MNLNFKGIYAITTKFLNVNSLTKDDQGNQKLTDEQQTQLSKEFGEKFVEKFNKELQSFNLESSEQSETESKTMDSDIEKLQVDLEQKNKELQTALTKSNIQKLLIDELSGLASEDEYEKIATQETSKNPGFKINMNYGFNKWAVGYMTGDKVMQYSGDSTIDASELKKEFGAYVQSGALPVITDILDQLDLFQNKCATLIVTDKEEWRAGHWIIDHVLQQFKPVWSPYGKVTVTPITIKNRIHKVNLGIIPSDIMSGYLGYLYQESKSPSEEPIVAYIINKLLLPKLREDLEFALCKGKFIEDTDMTDGKAAPDNAFLNCMDGLFTILTNLKAKQGNKATWIADGVVLTPDNILTEIQNAVDKIPYKYKNQTAFIYSDPQIITMYKRAYMAKYPNTKNEDKNNYTLDFTNFTFKPIAGLDGTSVFFITPVSNLDILCSPNGQDFRFYMQESDYKAKTFMDFKIGIGFAVEEVIFAYLPPVPSPPPTKDFAKKTIQSNDDGLN